MVEQDNIQDVFTNALFAKDEALRNRAVSEMLKSDNLDFQVFGQIAQIIKRIIYEHGDVVGLQEISTKFFPVVQTRENFQILETCFYALYTNSIDITNPERSRMILDQAILLLGLIGRNGMDISEGTAITAGQKHPLATESQVAQLRDNLMKCNTNKIAFMRIPPIAGIPKQVGNPYKGRVKV